MEATKEELKAAFKDLLSDEDFRREVRAEISPAGGFNPEARMFRAEVKEWSRTMNNTGHVSASLADGFNTVLRYNFNMRNVMKLADNQVPAARELFEKYKQLFGEVRTNG